MRRVVVTGIGIISPIGIGTKAYWENLTAGQCGIRRIAMYDPITYSAKIEQLSEQGASIAGTVTATAGGASEKVADIELMFSHIGQNMSGMEFPEHNFVFTEQFTELLKNYGTALAVTI